ncbi:uncharacterized protein LOC124681334 [Lolium rigidum]|uniref:uncharacterized protein LOC124681334 n=1 Tax=Lolium rigidum TaxID=89674 RepID=UPI001F5E0C7A|nr:uncharacterized protein LOC124681334 [Lolium rigidum]
MDAVSMVLDDDDLLLEIMIRLDLPTSLVRAILVCKRWFFVASDPVFLRCFRLCHPPRLLGFYVTTRSTSLGLLRPRFVPMPPDQLPQELAAAVRMAESYSLEAYNEDFACIEDLQNDTMIVNGLCGNRYAFEVHWPMSPHRGATALPVTPHDQLDGTACTAAHFILKVQDQGGRNRLVYVWLSMGFLIKGKGEYSVKYKAHIYVLHEDGQWSFHSSAAAVLPSPKSDSRPLLVGTKIYLEHSTSIVALDVKTSSFSTIPLPEEMERYDCKDMMLSAAYDSGFFLIHLDKDLELCIWLHIGDWWQLLDVVGLPEMFATLGMTGWTADGEPATLFQTTKTGDFAEFVFLKLGQCALCYDTRRRVLRKVHEVTQEDQTLEQIHPFMMTWPPIFPALKRDHLARNVS